MDHSKYNPYALTSFQKKGDNLYILGIIPRYYDRDFYYELHIKTESPSINNLKDSIGSDIYVELISNNCLEIHEGEFYEESCSDGRFEYVTYEYKKIEKENKNTWKPKVLKLESEFKKLFEAKLKPYELERRKAVDYYRRIYLEEIQQFSKEENEKLNKGNFFLMIYQLFENNPSWDSFNKLINPNYQYYPETPKNWEIEYLELEKIYNNLRDIDSGNYSVIKEHLIELYKRTFNYMLPNLKINYKDIDENHLTDFFYSILNKLNTTEE